MRLGWTGARWEFQCTAGESHIPKAAGMHFDWKNRLWWTGLTEIARTFETYADVRAKAKLNKEANAIALSKSLNSIIDFPVPDGLKYLDFQKAGIEYAATRANTLNADEMGLGKEQPLDALVLTPLGFKKMGELKLGEEVTGSNGKPYRITGIFPQGVKRVNKVTFNDGTSTECGEEHLWTTFPSDYKKSKKNWKVRKTIDIRANLFYKIPPSGRKPNLRHYIPIVSPVEFKQFKEEKLPLDPYALGYIIGKGSLSRGSTPGLTIPDNETKERLKSLLPVGIQHVQDFDYNLCDSKEEKENKFSGNPLTKILKTLGLLKKKAEEKFVPNEYLYSSIHAREEMIRGLLDSDGYNSGDIIQFYTSSKQLSEDFLFLIQSLGCIGYYSYNASPSFTYKGQKRISQPCHTITVSLREGFEPFKLTRKAKPRRKYYASRAIKAIDYAGEKECQCISVDSPDGLYVTDNFIVTHNTVQGIGLINAIPDIKNILIVAPAGLTLNWAKEILKWTTKKLSGDFASSTVLPDSDIVIVNYEIMSKLKEKIAAREWDLHIYDESHYLKNSEAKRTQAVLGSEHIKNCFPLEAKRRLFLTGTPILNRPVELWPMLRVIDPDGLGCNFWLFAKKFCGMREDDYGRDFSGSSNLDILQERLRSRVMIRRLKKDVLKELPPKRRQIISIPGSMAKKVIAAEATFYENNIALIEEAIQRAGVSQAQGDTESYNAATKDLRGLRQMMFEEISKLRHDTAVAKVPYLIQYLENALEQNDKIVLFAHHQDVINPIFQKFQSVSVKFDGSMNKNQKNASVELFQSDPKCKLFIGSITAAGVGITLTAASLALFAELDWRPAMVTQAEDRLHRIGQLQNVLIQHIVFDNSLDANMAKKIVSKQEMIDAAIG